jgi:hypothetical protein
MVHDMGVPYHAWVGYKMRLRTSLEVLTRAGGRVYRARDGPVAATLPVACLGGLGLETRSEDLSVAYYPARDYLPRSSGWGLLPHEQEPYSLLGPDPWEVAGGDTAEQSGDVAQVTQLRLVSVLHISRKAHGGKATPARLIRGVDCIRALLIRDRVVILLSRRFLGAH